MKIEIESYQVEEAVKKAVKEQLETFDVDSAIAKTMDRVFNSPDAVGKVLEKWIEGRKWTIDETVANIVSDRLGARLKLFGGRRGDGGNKELEQLRTDMQAIYSAAANDVYSVNSRQKYVDAVKMLRKELVK
jgi:hypothetical protein